HDASAPGWRWAIEMDLHDTLARRFAEMHAGDNFLADIAALLEIDAVHEVEVCIMHKSFAIDKIDAALGYALGDAMRLRGGLGSILEPRQGCVRRDDSKAHARRPRVAIGKAFDAGRRIAVET